jgi:hypothetical protein
MKERRRRMGWHNRKTIRETRNRGKNRKKLSFLCFFSKKQRRPQAAEEESN